MESARRATWTDERLDDLAKRIDDGFDRVDRDIRDMSRRIDSLQRIMIQFGGALTLSVLATLVSVIVTRA